MSRSRLSRLLPKFLRGEKSSKTSTDVASTDSKTPCCFIHFLDDSQHQIQIKGSWKGGQLLEKVCELLGLHEKDYFSLRFIDSAGQTHWLDSNKSLSSQFKGCQSPSRVKLYFGVKFYAADPCKLREEITRYLFFLQVKQDILQGRLPVTFDEAAELCAYAVQSELGDFDPRHHTPGYVSEFCFVQNQAEELEARIAAIHRRLGGLVPLLAEYRFLDKVKWLDMYGVDLHPVLGEGSVEYFLGLTPTGIVVYKNKNKVGNYFWPRINKVTFKGKVFIIKVKDKNNEEHAYAFELARKTACKHLWKCCVEHHAFFRLTQTQDRNNRPVRLSRSLSANRRSGRSERQAVSDNLSRQSSSVIRLPSRRQPRRVNSDSGLHSRDHYESQYNRDTGMVTMVMRPEPVRAPRHRSLPELQGRESPRSVKSAPWETNYDYGLYTVGKESPVSARSDRMSQQRSRMVSGSDSESGISQRKKYFPNRRGSDNDSDVSVTRRRRREVDSDSASDVSSRYPASQGHERTNKHSYAVLYPFHDKENRPNGSIPSLHSAPAGEAKQRRRRRRSKSPGKRPPDELKQHFEYGLKDTDGMSQEQLREIPFMKVETKASLFKLKYSPKLRQKVKAAKKRSISDLDMNRNQVLKRETSAALSEKDMSVRSQPLGTREKEMREKSAAEKNMVGRSRSFSRRPHSYHQSQSHHHHHHLNDPPPSSTPPQSNYQDIQDSVQLTNNETNHDDYQVYPIMDEPPGYTSSYEPPGYSSSYEQANLSISKSNHPSTASTDHISLDRDGNSANPSISTQKLSYYTSDTESARRNGGTKPSKANRPLSHYTSDNESARRHNGRSQPPRSNTNLPRYTSDTESSRMHYAASTTSSHRSHRSHHAVSQRDSTSYSHLPRSQGVYESDNNSMFRSDDPHQRDAPTSRHAHRTSGRYGQNQTTDREPQTTDRVDHSREPDYEHSLRHHQYSGSKVDGPRLDGSRSGQMEGQGHNEVPDAVSGYSYRERGHHSNYSSARPLTSSTLHPNDSSRASHYSENQNNHHHQQQQRQNSNTFSPHSQSPSRSANHSSAYNHSNYYDPGQRSGSYEQGERSREERPALPPRLPYQEHNQSYSEQNSYRPVSRAQYDSQQTHRYSQQNPPVYTATSQIQYREPQDPPPHYQVTPPQYRRTSPGNQRTPPRHQGTSTQNQGMSTPAQGTPPRHMNTPPRRTGPSPGEGRYSQGLLSVHSREQSEGSQTSALTGGIVHSRSSRPSPSVSDRSTNRTHGGTVTSQLLRNSTYNPELCTEL